MRHARLCWNELNVACTIVPEYTTRELWHKRLYRMSEKGMQMLAERELLPKVKNVNMDKCVDCLASK